MCYFVYCCYESLSHSPPHQNCGSYFFIFGKCGVTLHRLCRDSLTLKDDCHDNPFGKTGYKEKRMEKDKSFGEILDDVREENINRPIIGQLNLNSIRNKFHFVESEDSEHLDILLLSETKTDESFPQHNFC